MEIKSIEEQGRIILEVSGRIDTTTAGSFEKQVLPYLQSGSELVLDCDQVEYISSAGLRSLLILAKVASARDSRIVLCRLSGLVREVLEISGFDSFFEVRHERNA